MNITELRYLVAIRKWGSVSAAAKQLYAAQPNVSKALKIWRKNTASVSLSARPPA